MGRDDDRTGETVCDDLCAPSAREQSPLRMEDTEANTQGDCLPLLAEDMRARRPVKTNQKSIYDRYGRTIVIGYSR